MHATHKTFRLIDGGYGCKICRLCDCHSPEDSEKECTGPSSPKPDGSGL